MLEAGRGEEGVELRPKRGVAARKKPRRVGGRTSGGETLRKVCDMVSVAGRKAVRGDIRGVWGGVRRSGLLRRDRRDPYGLERVDATIQSVLRASC